MAGHDSRRAALLLIALGAAGLVVRLAVGGGAPLGEVAYRRAADARPERDSVAARAARLARPLRRGETVDLDRAPADELVRLPRIGPALAARIVADREAHGPFGSLEALARVPGIGPVTLKALAPHAAFSAVSAVSASGIGGAGRPVRLNQATVEELSRLPGVGPKRAAAIVRDRARRGPYRRLEDLTRVSGIGPVTVERLRPWVQVP